MGGRDPGHLSYAFSIRSSNTSSLHLLREISPRLYSNPEYYIRIHKDPTEIFQWHQPPKDIHTMISRSCGYRDHSQISSITITAIIYINEFASTRKLAPCLTSELAYVNSFVNRIREVELISTYRIPQLRARRVHSNNITILSSITRVVCWRVVCIIRESTLL